MSRCQRRTIYRPSLLHASSLLQPETRFSPQPLVLILASASKHLPWADGPRVRQPCFHLRLCKQCLAQPVSIELGFKHGCISPKCLWCMFRSLLSEGHRDDPGGAPGKQRKRETEESQMDRSIHQGLLQTLTKYLPGGMWPQDGGKRGSSLLRALSSQSRGRDRIRQSVV